MNSYFVDWHSHLLPGIHETLTDPNESANAILYLYENQSIRTFCMMPTFFPFRDSVAAFLLRRDRAMERLACALREKPPKNYYSSESPRIPRIRLLFGASVALESGCYEVEQLSKLAVPFNGIKFLPIRLPALEFADWIDFEINRLLYRTNVRLWFTSFEFVCKYYPPEITKKLCRISDAIYQFGYRSLEDKTVQHVIKSLLERRATVLLGTSLNCLEKSYRCDLSYNLSIAKTAFTDFEYHSLIKNNLKIPQNHPKMLIV